MWPLNITLHLTGFLIAIERVILNLIEKYKGLAVAKVTPKWRTNLGDLLLPDLKIYYNATVIQCVVDIKRDKKINEK